MEVVRLHGREMEGEHQAGPMTVHAQSTLTMAAAQPMVEQAVAPRHGPVVELRLMGMASHQVLKPRCTPALVMAGAPKLHSTKATAALITNGAATPRAPVLAGVTAMATAVHLPARITTTLLSIPPLLV